MGRKKLKDSMKEKLGFFNEINTSEYMCECVFEFLYIFRG